MVGNLARYIDADAFEKFIKEKYKDGESTDDIKDQMLFDLSYQPTAYDVEKVVAELNDYYEERLVIVTPQARERVEEIVRNGGKE